MRPTAARALAAREAPGRLGPLWTFLFRYGPPRWTEYVLKNWSGQRLVIALPYLWLLVFFLVPFLIVLKISFAEFSPLGRPPYEAVFDFSLLEWSEKGVLQVKVLVGSYYYLFHEPLYVSSWLYSLKVAFFSTVLCLMLGYPMAYAIARSQPTYRNLFLMLVILPFWTSFLLRVYAWIGLLKNDGEKETSDLAYGMFILRAETRAEAEALAFQEPNTKAGLRTMKVIPWARGEGDINISISFTNGTVKIDRRSYLLDNG